MTTNTHRHTARPSRSRVILARVAGALNRAMDYGDRHLTAVTVVLNTFAAVALALLIAFDDDRAAVAVVSVAVCAFVAFVTFAATSDAAITAYAKTHRASVARIVATHDAQREEWNTYCDQVAQRNEERLARVLAERDEARRERDRLKVSLRADAETIRRVVSDRDWISESLTQCEAERDEARRERDEYEAAYILAKTGIPLA